HGHGIAYDRKRDQAVLFGGQGLGGLLADTWIFDGLAWTLRSATGPTPRAYARLAEAAHRERLLLHGGMGPNFLALDDTWEWNGTQWTATALLPNPPARFDAHLAEDPSNGDMLRFGGVDAVGAAATTWRFAADFPARSAVFGTSCPNPLGPLTLAAAPDTRPWLGDVYELQLTGLPPQPGLAVVVFGYSDQSWNGQSLPQSLAGFGMPACTLYAAAVDPFLVIHQGGSLRFPFPLPNAPWLRGFVYFNQATAFAPAYGNALGAASSNAVRTTLGAR
ncbi:MAG: hypothetical protein RL398_851, partial [Planctomycetota bacterium]